MNKRLENTLAAMSSKEIYVSTDVEAVSSGSKPFPESQYSSATQPDSISYSFTGT